MASESTTFEEPESDRLTVPWHPDNPDCPMTPRQKNLLKRSNN